MLRRVGATTLLIFGAALSATADRQVRISPAPPARKLDSPSLASVSHRQPDGLLRGKIQCIFPDGHGGCSNAVTFKLLDLEDRKSAESAAKPQSRLKE